MKLETGKNIELRDTERQFMDVCLLRFRFFNSSTGCKIRSKVPQKLNAFKASLKNALATETKLLFAWETMIELAFQTS